MAAPNRSSGSANSATPEVSWFTHQLTGFVGPHGRAAKAGAAAIEAAVARAATNPQPNESAGQAAVLGIAGHLLPSLSQTVGESSHAGPCEAKDGRRPPRAPAR